MEKRTIVKGGELPRPLSGSGITVGDETLEEIVAEEESKEIAEEMTPENLALYRKNRSRIKAHKESNGPTRILTRREINAENWEKTMEQQKTIEGVIASLLLSGREVTGREMQNNCVRQIQGVTKKLYSQRSTYLYHKTDFGKFVVSRRDGKGAAYKLVAAALECKVEELLRFVYKGDKKGRETILDHHKGLRPYLESPAKEKKAEDRAKEKAKKPEPPSKETSIGIATAIRDVVAQELGVNVSVSGRVEIVFKWE